MTVEPPPEPTRHTPATVPRDLDPATVDQYAQAFAGLVRQVGVRHGRGASLTEAAGLIMASAVMLSRLCGPACVMSTMAWHAERATVSLGPETQPPFTLTDDGMELPEPRTIGAASHHAVRHLQEIARAHGTDRALEIICGTLRAGVAIVREQTDAKVLAHLLENYAEAAATATTMEPDEIAALMPEQVH